MNHKTPAFLPKFFATTTLSLALSSPLHAQDNNLDEYWRYTQLYKNEQGNFLNLSGRLQGDAAYFDDHNNDYSDTLWRRFRFGFKAKYGHINADLEASLDLNNGAKYERLTDANLSWLLDKNMKLTVLKHSAGFTLDGRTSSKKLLTPQRNNLTNNLWFTAEYFTGISIQGEFDNNMSYKGGIFSSDDSDEIGLTGASYFALLSLTANYNKTPLWQKAQVTLDYVYNDVDEQGNTRDFSHVVSFSSKLNFGKWHMWSDASYGQGDLEQSDLWGLVVMPYYQHTKKIQWVMRYTYLDSQHLNGIRLGKYENQNIAEKGDNYREIYAGMNYLINQHKLKVHLGAQYTQMKDTANDGGKYNGWGVTLAFRSYW